MMSFMVLALIGMFINYSGWLTIDFTILLRVDGLLLLMMVLLISLIALAITYPLLKDAPLKPKTKKD